jgi:hypothetical protein
LLVALAVAAAAVGYVVTRAAWILLGVAGVAVVAALVLALAAVAIRSPRARPPAAGAAGGVALSLVALML